MIKKFSVFCFIIFPSLGFASLKMDHVLDQMQAQCHNIQTIKITFQQETKLHHVDGLTKVEGDAIFQKPKRIWIQTHLPQNQLTISNGKKTWVYLQDNKQAWVSSANSSVDSLLPLASLLSMESKFVREMRKNYQLKIIRQKETPSSQVWLSAQPKNSGTLSDFQFEFCLSTSTWLPYQIDIHTGSADIHIKIKNSELNPVISSSLFTFQPPKGTEVISLN